MNSDEPIEIPPREPAWLPSWVRADPHEEVEPTPPAVLQAPKVARMLPTAEHEAIGDVDGAGYRDAGTPPRCAMVASG
ncbi:MAG: hypothetical protein K0V04_42290 [Deltaproteobacteria bacterium]|nr:hypothetical protein [Deltaproteobacteria bacterium]